ncbi:MAG: ABC transporter substrate-binding protein, partial [Candidatus Dormibacteraceae bacterium]
MSSRRWSMLVAGLAALTLLLAACGSSGNGGPSPGKAADTASWAEPTAAGTPNDIWPFLPAEALSVINAQFQQQMYRPLYFSGANGSVNVSPSLSLAQLPSFSQDGKTITITMKSNRWSDGEAVDASDVLFWINMDKAEKENYGNYSPGYFPDNVVSASAPNPTTVVITTDHAYSHNWFLLDQLSQIIPMPAAWDVTGPGQKSDCATVEADCPAVYKYLAAQAKSESTYATNPLWQVVDGPWKLKSFSTDGNVSFVPNKAYTGPGKPTLHQFDMDAFTSDAAEFNVLRSGKSLDVGYIPTQDLSKPKPKGTSPLTPGPNPLSGYTMVPQVVYMFNFFVLNYTNPELGPLFDQLYLRQALQSLVDQPALIRAAAKNYGVQSYGAVPTVPKNPAAPVSSLEKHNPYPFSIAAAKKYLSDNGWNVTPNAASTCARPGTGPGECGAGVAAGQKLAFSMIYATGSSQMATTMESLKSNAAQAGIDITLRAETFDAVINVADPCAGTSCTWQLANWGGWTYGQPLPTGEELFETGSLNAGGYSNSQLDHLIAATHTSNSPAVYEAYENAVAKDLPVIFEPTFTSQLNEVAPGLKG